MVPRGRDKERLAVYTTVYPSVLSFLPAWYRSLAAQTDQDYRLWIGLDGTEIEAVQHALGLQLEATWVPGEPGSTPGEVRQRAWQRIVERHDAVILVDSDDVMHASRIAAARELLETNDLVGCALRLVDAEGSAIGGTLTVPPDIDPDDLLPQHNVFGLSNTAIRSDLLLRCLPIPSAAVLVDWFIATRAWLMGTRLFFDRAVRMDYRQHGANMVHVRPPFGTAQVVRDTERLRGHFRLVLASVREDADAHRIAKLTAVAAEIEMFHRYVVSEPERLQKYVRTLNKERVAYVWGACVANPSLRHMWTCEKEPV